MIQIRESHHYWNKAYSFSCTTRFLKLGNSYINLGKTKIFQSLKELKKGRNDSKTAYIVKQIKNNDEACKFLTGGVICCIPPSKTRDFQPVSALAEALAEELKLGYIRDAIPVFLVDTTTELPKDAHKTRKNPCYYIPDESIFEAFDKGVRIILFDDYYDTGETVNNASRALKEYGFTEVDVFTVCYTQNARKRIMNG